MEMSQPARGGDSSLISQPCVVGVSGDSKPFASEISQSNTGSLKNSQVLMGMSQPAQGGDSLLVLRRCVEGVSGDSKPFATEISQSITGSLQAVRW